MRTVFIFTFILSVYSNSAFAQTPEQKLIGNWYVEALAKSTISIYQDNAGFFFGKIIASAEPDKIGKIPLLNFKFSSNKNKFLGKVKSASTPFELDGEITFLNDKTIQLVGSRLFLSKTFVLIKI